MYSVMLVDDEPLVLESLSMKVPWERHGFLVVAFAGGGREAMEKLKTQTIHLLMTDIRMPGIDGIQLIAHARALYPNIKTLIVSGYDDFAYAKRALEFEVKGYLLKPVDRYELADALDRLREMLDREGEARPPAPAALVSGRPAVLDEILRYIEARYAEELSVKQIASAFFLNAAYLGQLFKKHMGEGFNEYLSRLRINAVKRLLTEQPMLSIAEVIQRVGYRNPAYFYTQFKRYEGVPFKQYRDRHLPGPR